MNKITGYFLLLLSPTLILGAEAAQAASFVIDEFNVPNSPSQRVNVGRTQSPPGNPQIPFSEQPTGLTPFPETEVVGGYRDLFLTNVNGSPNLRTRGASASVGGNILRYANDTAVYSRLEVTWDGKDNSSTVKTNGLGGIDLTQGGKLEAIGLDFLFADRQLSATINVYDMMGNLSTSNFIFNSCVEEGNANCLDAPQPVYFVYDSQEFNQINKLNKALFTGTADFTKVGAIQLLLNGSPSTLTALDAQIDSIKSESLIAEIPEPTTSLLGFAGIALLGAVSKSRKK